MNILRTDHDRNQTPSINSTAINSAATGNSPTSTTTGASLQHHATTPPQVAIIGSSPPGSAGSDHAHSYTNPSLASQIMSDFSTSVGESSY